MDRENRGIAAYIKLPFLLACLIISTTIYSFACLVTGFFSKPLAQYFGIQWCGIVLGFAGVRLKVQGREKLEKGKRYVFFSNHQSSLDIPVVYSGLSVPLCFVAKKELFLIPLLGWGMASMGHVKIDRSNARKARSSLTRAIRHLQRFHLSLFLFPEGTRSVSGELAEFRQGSFALALEAGVPVVPLAIRNAGKVLPKKSLLLKPGTIYLDIGDPIDAGGMDKSHLAATVRREIEKVLQKAEV